MFAFMLFPGYFFYLLVDKLKNQLIIITVHVYFNLRQCLVALKGFFVYLNNLLYLSSNHVKNKIVSFFDPRVRDPHSIIANVLILFSLVPVFIFLFVTLVSYKIIFIPILQVVFYLRRVVVVVRLMRFIGSFFRKLLAYTFPNASLSMIAGLKVKALISTKGLEVYLTRIPFADRREFMEKYAHIFVYSIEGLDNMERERIIARSLRFFQSGLSDHFNISLLVPYSNVQGYPLLINAALTSDPKPISKLIAVINEEVIYSRPDLVVDLDRVTVAASQGSQYLLSNTFTVSNSEYTSFIDPGSNPAINPSFCSDRNISGIGCVVDKITPLAKQLEGVHEPGIVRREVMNFQRSTFSADEAGLSSGIVFPVFKEIIKNLS